MRHVKRVKRRRKKRTRKNAKEERRTRRHERTPHHGPNGTQNNGTTPRTERIPHSHDPPASSPSLSVSPSSTCLGPGARTELRGPVAHALRGRSHRHAAALSTRRTTHRRQGMFAGFRGAVRPGGTQGAAARAPPWPRPLRCPWPRRGAPRTHSPAPRRSRACNACVRLALGERDYPQDVLAANGQRRHGDRSLARLARRRVAQSRRSRVNRRSVRPDRRRGRFDVGRPLGTASRGSAAPAIARRPRPSLSAGEAAARARERARGAGTRERPVSALLRGLQRSSAQRPREGHFGRGVPSSRPTLRSAALRCLSSTGNAFRPCVLHTTKRQTQHEQMKESALNGAMKAWGRRGEEGAGPGIGAGRGKRRMQQHTSRASGRGRRTRNEESKARRGEAMGRRGEKDERKKKPNARKEMNDRMRGRKNGSDSRRAEQENSAALPGRIRPSQKGEKERKKGEKGRKGGKKGEIGRKGEKRGKRGEKGEKSHMHPGPLRKTSRCAAGNG